LKKRLAPKNLTSILENRKFPLIKGCIVCDLPNKELYEFKGSLFLKQTSVDNTLSGDLNFVLSESQLLLKGSKLMNTEWVVGIVVYSGNDTKLMQN
jgi:phospholipid-transporting ATPase